MNKTLISLTFFLLCFLTNAQIINLITNDLDVPPHGIEGEDCKAYLFLAENKPINYRFEGKEDGFRKFLQNKLRYPEKSATNKVIGLSISSITITPNGEIEEISIISSIDNWIDKEVIRLLKLTEKYWQECDTITTNQTFYVQIGFDINDMLKNSEIQNFFINNAYFCEKVYVTAITLFPDNVPISDKNLTSRCDKLISTGKYSEALPIIDDLIKRHPYYKDLYQVRIMINKKLNNIERINEDLQKITNFIPGVSLDELLNPLSGF